MRLPAIQGIIDRRILANFRIDAERMAAALPKPFRPQLVNGYAIGGICLIRLKRIRPKFSPLPWGLFSENAAHRIAVEWDEAGETKQGVYIPRRDTSSRLNAMAGGTLFPGLHHHARFDVVESDDHFSITMSSKDGSASVHVSASITDRVPDQSVFDSLKAASQFFERGALGYSDTPTDGKFDGLELQCLDWKVQALKIESIKSSYFEDISRFPKSTVEFDCALLMRDIQHGWHSRADLCCKPVTPP